MHNLHLAVVRAESAQDACNYVENEITEYGNDNNWRTICGSVSEDNEVFINDGDGRYAPDDDSNTIDKINSMVEGWLKGTFYGEQARVKLKESNGNIDLTTWDTADLFSLEEYAKFLYQLKSIEQGREYNRKQGKTVKDTFDVLAEDFFEYKYDQCGVTNFTNNQDETEGDKIYVVFIDMHS